MLSLVIAFMAIVCLWSNGAVAMTSVTTATTSMTGAVFLATPSQSLVNQSSESWRFNGTTDVLLAMNKTSCSAISHQSPFMTAMTVSIAAARPSVSTAQQQQETFYIASLLMLFLAVALIVNSKDLLETWRRRIETSAELLETGPAYVQHEPMFWLLCALMDTGVQLGFTILPLAHQGRVGCCLLAGFVSGKVWNTVPHVFTTREYAMETLATMAMTKIGSTMISSLGSESGSVADALIHLPARDAVCFFFLSNLMNVLGYLLANLNHRHLSLNTDSAGTIVQRLWTSLSSSFNLNAIVIESLSSSGRHLLQNKPLMNKRYVALFYSNDWQILVGSLMDFGTVTILSKATSSISSFFECQTTSSSIVVARAFVFALAVAYLVLRSTSIPILALQPEQIDRISLWATFIRSGIAGSMGSALGLFWCFRISSPTYLVGALFVFQGSMGTIATLWFATKVNSMAERHRKAFREAQETARRLRKLQRPRRDAMCERTFMSALALRCELECPRDPSEKPCFLF